MKKLSILLIISILLSAAVGCAPDVSDPEVTTGSTDAITTETVETPPEETVSLPETTIIPEVTVLPETTVIPETTVAPETTTAPETTAAPETTEPPAVIPEVTVSTFDELSAAASDIGLEAGTVIRIVNEIEIPSLIVFRVPVTLSLEADIICTCPIIFETFEKGKIEILIASGVKTNELDLRFDAPFCDLVWLSNSPYEDYECAAHKINAATYNGVDLRAKYGLGGVGTKKMTAFVLGTKENNLLRSDIEWNIDGNTVYAAISYLVNFNAMNAAHVSIGLNDGSTVTQTLDLTIPEQLVNIKDENGGERTYKVITERITYNLPVFYIDIEGGAEVTSKEEYLNAEISVDTSKAYGDFPGLELTDVRIRGRGHFSWQFDKTPYKLKFDKKTSMLGMSASKDWVLLANYVDRSLIQNYVAMEMGKVMTNIPYHSSQYPVDVFVNGTYRGVYTFGEQLEVKKERINLEESYSELDTDYLIEIGGNDDGDVLGRDYFHSYLLKYVKIKHPETVKMTQEQIDYLIAYVNKADLAVISLKNYEDYIDVDSLIDWVIIHELTYNLDCCFRRSCYLIKEKGGKLKMGPIWDFDLGFGSYRRYTEDNWATVGSEGGYVWTSWMNYLMKDEAFMKRFAARWNEIKKPLINCALTSVETMSELVKPSAEMNFEVWDILGKAVTSQPTSHKKYDTYEKMIGRLEDFLAKRYNWIDKQLNP